MPLRALLMHFFIAFVQFTGRSISALALFAPTAYGLDEKPGHNPNNTRKNILIVQSDETTKSQKKISKGWNLGVGSSLLLPITRPAAIVALTSSETPWSLGLRISGSYAPLSSSFKTAADRSDYSAKISETQAYLWDINVAAPEITLSLPRDLYVSLTPALRSTRCISNYKTTNSESLTFSGWAFTVSAESNIAYRIDTPLNKLFFEIFAGLAVPLWSAGVADLSFQRNALGDSANFSENEIELMLESLQPYLEKVSKLSSIELGVKAFWRF